MRSLIRSLKEPQGAQREHRQSRERAQREQRERERERERESTEKAQREHYSYHTTSKTT